MNIEAILAAHGIRGRWTRLAAHGVANDIYATENVVLRVATDHPEAEPDARTESVAAPAAYAAGILTPRLIAFDDSRTLVDRPYSLWDRVHGETLGAIALDRGQDQKIWGQVGRELGRLHTRVALCEDPNGWLDAPGRRRDLQDGVNRMRHEGRLGARPAADMIALIREIEAAVDVDVTPRFIHHDVHPWNIMCSADRDLLAIIDWGDAGWGDPALDFGYIPLDGLPAALAAYASEAPGLLGTDVGARLAWDQLQHGLERMMEHDAAAPDVAALRRLLP